MADHPGADRVRTRLSCTAQKSQQQQDSDLRGHSEQTREQRPSKDVRCQHDSRSKSIAKPARRNLAQSIGNEECEKGIAHLCLRHPEINSHRLRRNSHGIPVKVQQASHDCQECDNHDSNRCWSHYEVTPQAVHWPRLQTEIGTIRSSATRV